MSDFIQIVALLAGIWSVGGISHARLPSDAYRKPEIRLRTIIDRERFIQHAEIAVRVEFTNLSSKTLCFPDPDRRCENTESGSLITRMELTPGESFIGMEPTPDERDVFLCHFDGGSVWPREKLLQEIERRWIKIAPNATFTTNGEVQGELKRSGEWNIRSEYSPPAGAFHPAEFREYIESAARDSGCAVPTRQSQPKLFESLWSLTATADSV